MNGYTKGPWVARKVGGAGFAGQVGWAIDYNEDQEQVVDFVYEEADANLVAAAPELFEALKDMMDGYLYGCSMPEKRANVEKARAAIAKAKGEPK